MSSQESNTSSFVWLAVMLRMRLSTIQHHPDAAQIYIHFFKLVEQVYFRFNPSLCHLIYIFKC